MPPVREYRHSLSDSRRRGLPHLAFRLRIPEAVELTPAAENAAGGLVVVGHERRADGRVVGDLEIAVVSAALLIDRDGALERLVTAAAERATGEIDAMHGTTLDGGASGFRANLIQRIAGAARPTSAYVTLLALASLDASVRGAVLVTARSSQSRWPALDELLGSLWIGTRDSAEAANDESSGLGLPMLGRRGR